MLTAVAGFDLHRGVVASADRRAAGIRRPAPSARRVVVLEGLNDPENLGAIARSARALGADALLLDPRCADPFARRTVRVSMGEILFLPLPGSIPGCRGYERSWTTASSWPRLTPDADAPSISDWVPAERVGLMLGAEGPGLMPTTMAASGRRLRIPIRPGVDSLNVGHAAAVALALLNRATRRSGFLRRVSPENGACSSRART